MKQSYYEGRKPARYFISAHACYLPDNKIKFSSDVNLDFFSFEGECLHYTDAYLRTFCKKGIHKRLKGYTPAFTAKKTHYQMRFSGALDTDYLDVPMFIYCCDTDSFLYKFYNEETGYVNKDIYLNNVIDLIQLHKNIYLNDDITKNGKTYKKYNGINISILTCNNSCYNEFTNKTYVVKLSKMSEGITQNFGARTLNNLSAVKESRRMTSTRRKAILRDIDETPIQRHIFKPNDMVLIKSWEQLKPKNKKQYNAFIQDNIDFLLVEKISETHWNVDGIDEPVLEEDLYYYSPIMLGDNVMYNKKHYRVIGETKTHTNSINRIVDLNTGEELDIPHEELIQILF